MDLAGVEAMGGYLSVRSSAVVILLRSKLRRLEHNTELSARSHVTFYVQMYDYMKVSVVRKSQAGGSVQQASHPCLHAKCHRLIREEQGIIPGLDLYSQFDSGSC